VAQVSTEVKSCQWESGTVEPLSGTKAPSMGLSKKEFRNRVLAAAALHGLGLRTLRDHLEEFGADRTLAESLINDPAKRKPKQLRDLTEALEVPAAWFEAPDWRSLISEGAAAAEAKGDEIGELKAQRSVLLSTIAQVRSELEDLRKRPPLQ
jgi:hypothetical protein